MSILLEVIGAGFFHKLVDILTQSQEKNQRRTLNEPAQKELDELDLAFMRSLASYFEEMPDKIRHYHRDHHASQEEAEVIANYYLKTADIVRGIKTQKDLKELLEFLEALKEKVSRYQHENYKYRWSTGLEKEVLEKLKKILP